MSMTDSKSLHDRLSKTVRGLPRSGIRDFFDIVSTRKDIISLGIGEPDFEAPWHIREAIIHALEGGATSYTSNLGILQLRERISKYVARTFGPTYDPDKEIIITVGVSEALDLAVRALTNPGDEILYHQPAYVSYAPIIQMAGGVPVPVVTRMEDDFRLSVDALREKVSDKTKALLLNFPNNPTGAALSAEDVRAISEFAIERDLFVITDEIYSELTYEGRHVSIASMPNMRERTIFLHGFSKAWAMTGLRVGYACSPPELTEAMMKVHQYTIMCAPTPSQVAAIEALVQPEKDIEEMRSEYHKRRNFIYRSFEEMGLPCSNPRGAFYAFPYVGEFGLTSSEFAMKLLDEENVAAVPGTAFGQSGEGFLRCAYAASMDDLKEAMSRIADLLERMRNP